MAEKKWYNVFVSVEDEQKKSAASDVQTSIATTRLEVAEPQLEQPVARIGEEFPSFEAIYQAFGIKDASTGFTIYRVEELLKSAYIKNASAEVKRSALMVALEALRVSPEEVIQDAVKRDKALTQFEKIEERRLRELEQKKSEENKRLQEEMERIFNEIREKMEDNNNLIKETRDKFQTWQQEKEKEEQRLSSVLQYFVSQEVPEQAHGTRRRRTTSSEN
ncbi:MAG TPA: hypothetical protein VLX91_15880 [Candidatus Acidoferrales bacterium]|nr:hypothetical protein [Candidatus Acidoferrales bacterium]